MMDKAQNGQTTDSLHGFGAVLKASREEQGISLGDMEARSRLSVAQLKALEEEDMSHLPEPVYVRAFIRSVAQVLRIDPTPLLADYSNRYGGAKQTAGILPTSDLSHEPVLSHSSSHRGLRLLGMIVILALLVAGAWYAYTDEGGLRTQLIDKVTGHSSSSDEGAKPAAPVVPGTPSPTLKPEEVTKPAGLNAPTTATPPAVGGTTLSAPTAEPANQTMGQPAATTPATAAAASTQASKDAPKDVKNAKDVKDAKEVKDATAAKTAEPAKPQPKSANERQVMIRVSANCWVEVLGLNGEKIYSREMSAGTSTTLVVPVGARFTMGNAPAVSMTVDGAAYEIGQHAKGAVARFALK